MSASEYFKKREACSNRSMSSEPAPRNNSRPNSAPSVEPIKCEVVKQSDVLNESKAKRKLLTSRHLDSLKNELHSKIDDKINNIHVKLSDLLKHDDLSLHKEDIEKKTNELHQKINDLHDRLKAVEDLLPDD